MNAHELAERINAQLFSKYPNKEECLNLLNELEKFVKESPAEEVKKLLKECPYGEMFIMLATSFNGKSR